MVAYRQLYSGEFIADPARGSGRTREQIMQLRFEGWFVVLGSTLNYTRALLHHLGRDDVTLVGFEACEGNDFNNLRSYRLTDLDVDHAVWESLQDRRRYAAYDRLAETFNTIRHRIHGPSA
jgi:hypothetical protein